MKKNDRPEIHYHFEFHAPVGQQIAHIDHQEVHFDKDMQMKTLDTVTNEKEEENPIVTQLLPVFLQNRNEARLFFEVAICSDPLAITTKVNELIDEKKVARNLCKGDLWKILNEAGLYPRCCSNWNKMIKI